MDSTYQLVIASVAKQSRRSMPKKCEIASLRSQ